MPQRAEPQWGLRTTQNFADRRLAQGNKLLGTHEAIGRNHGAQMNSSAVPTNKPIMLALEATALLFARLDMRAADSTPMNSQIMESIESVT